MLRIRWQHLVAVVIIKAGKEEDDRSTIKIKQFE